MADRYEVDIDELETLHMKAKALSFELSYKHVDGSALSGDAGHHLVESAHGHFAGHWSDGLWKISQNLEKLAERLRSASEAYGGTEDSITAAAKGS